MQEIQTTLKELSVSSRGAETTASCQTITERKDSCLAGNIEEMFKTIQASMLNANEQFLSRLAQDMVRQIQLEMEKDGHVAGQPPDRLLKPSKLDRGRTGSNTDTAFACCATFVADLSRKLVRVSAAVEDEDGFLSATGKWILHRADLPNGLVTRPAIFISWWSPGQSIRRFELRGTPRSLKRFLPRLTDNGYRTYSAYHEDLVRLMDSLSNDIMPHGSESSLLTLELGSVNEPLQVRCYQDTHSVLRYPSVSEFNGLGLELVPETVFTDLDPIAGWVYTVEIEGTKYVRKDIVDQSQVESFCREVLALAKLQNRRNVVKVYGLVTDSTRKCAKGVLVETLSPLARHLDYLTQSETFSVIDQLLQIVADVHAAGFVIGEVVLVQFGYDDDGRVKLLGIKQRGCPHTNQPPETLAKTTANYNSAFCEGIFNPAPKRLSIKSDIWQLGALIFQVSMGLHFTDTLHQIHCSRSGLEAALPEFGQPRWIAPTIISCLEYEPENRPFAKELLLAYRERYRLAMDMSTERGDRQFGTVGSPAHRLLATHAVRARR